MVDPAQTHLDLADPPPFSGSVEAGGAWLVALLLAHPAGLTARQIAAKIGRPWSEQTGRRIRQFSEAAGDLVIGGPRGYRHRQHTPLEDQKRAAQRELAQGRKMAQRALRRLRAIQVYEAVADRP